MTFFATLASRFARTAFRWSLSVFRIPMTDESRWKKIRRTGDACTRRRRGNSISLLERRRNNFCVSGSRIPVDPPLRPTLLLRGDMIQELAYERSWVCDASGANKKSVEKINARGISGESTRNPWFGVCSVVATHKKEEGDSDTPSSSRSTDETTTKREILNKQRKKKKWSDVGTGSVSVFSRMPWASLGRNQRVHLSHVCNSPPVKKKKR